MMSCSVFPTSARKADTEKSQQDTVEVLRGLWSAFLADVGKTEQDIMALDEKEFCRLLQRHTEDPVLTQRLRGHREDLWGSFFGFETRRGSMTDMKVRRAS